MFDAYFYLVTDKEPQCGNPVIKPITYLLTTYIYLKANKIF